MPVNLRNVKSITLDGRVSLRGPVNPAGEKHPHHQKRQRIGSGN